MTLADLRRFEPQLIASCRAFWPEANYSFVPLGEADEKPGNACVYLPLVNGRWELGYLLITPFPDVEFPVEILEPYSQYLSQLLENFRLRKSLTTDRDSGLFSRDYFYRRLLRALKNQRGQGVAPRSLTVDGEAAKELFWVVVELPWAAEMGDTTLDAFLSSLEASPLRPQFGGRISGHELAFLVHERPEDLRLALENILLEQVSSSDDPLARPVAAWASLREAGNDDGTWDEGVTPQQRHLRRWETKVRTALFQARQSRGAVGAVAYGDILENYGQIVQLLPLDRVVINLGREAGAAPGQVFLAYAADTQNGSQLEFKGELTVYETAENYALAHITGLKLAMRFVAGDRLRFSRLEPDSTALKGSKPQQGFLAQLPGREEFLQRVAAIMDKPMALMAIRLDSFEQKVSLLGKEEAERLTNFVFERACKTLPATELSTLWRPHILTLVWPEAEQAQLMPLAHNLIAELKEVGLLSMGLVFNEKAVEPASLVEDALKALAEADFYGPGHVAVFGPLALYVSGDRLYEGGDISGAVREYERGLSLDPNHVNLLNSLGVCQGRLGRSEESLATFTRIIELDPANLMAFYNLGYTHLLAGRLNEAEEALQKASQIDPDNFETLFHLGKTSLELGHLDQALKALRRAGELSDSRPVVYRLLGEALLLAHDHQGALAAFKKAVKIAPNDAYALSALGALFVDLANDLEPARSLFQKSVEIDPTNSLYRQRLGRLLYTLEDFSGAEHHLTMALEYGSSAPEVYYHLGLLAEKADKQQEAKRYFQQALDSDPAYQPALGRKAN